MEALINKINSFDFFFEMSDSCVTYDRGTRAKKEILQALDNLSETQLRTLKTQIKISDEVLMRHFANLAEVKREAKSNFRSMLFKTAWYYFRKGMFLSFSQSLKAAWRRMKAVAELKSGEAGILYRKADGKLREAKGTLKAEVLAFYPGNSRKLNPDVVPYWDLEKMAWRSFRIERLLSISAT